MASARGFDLPMKSVSILPSNMSGTLKIPPSKSHTMRAIIFAFLASGTSKIKNYLISPDTEAMLKAIQQMGAKVKKEDTSLYIEGTAGKILKSSDIIDAGNSGIVLRFIAALAALSPEYFVITGDESIKKSRPAKELIKGLRDFGVECSGLGPDERAPLIIKGPLCPGRAVFNGQDSQPVSALLIATSLLKSPSIIEISNPGEKPWIDMTLGWLKSMGAQVKNENYDKYIIEGDAKYFPFEMTIPGDFSSAAFPIAAALITNSEITLDGLIDDPMQGDRKFIDIIQSMGALVERISFDKIKVHKGSFLKAATIDINDCIDALPVLSALACFAKGQTKIYNGAIARNKESDRISAIASELKKMGANITEKEDGLIIEGSSLHGNVLSSYKDHRIALSLATAALGAKGNTCIQDVECIQKTYRSFFEDFINIGCKFEIL